MRIIQVHSFWSQRGGDTTYTLALTRALKAAGHEVAWFTEQREGQAPSEWEAFYPPAIDLNQLQHRRDPLAIAQVFNHVIYNRKARDGLAAMIDVFRPDVVHVQHVHHHLTPSVLDACRSRGVRVVWTLHDYELLCPTGHFFRDGHICEDCALTRYHHAVLNRCERGSWGASLVAAVEKTVHHHLNLPARLDLFITPSIFLGHKLMRYGVPPAKIRHLPYFIDLPDKPSPDGEGVLFAGRLSPDKGVATLLQAAALLPHIPFMIAGSGPDTDRIRALAAPLSNVKLLGWLTRDELEVELRASRVVVVPSIWYENLPFAVGEAQAHGKVVIGSNIGGIPELISHGETGLLFPPGDHVNLSRLIGEVYSDVGTCHRLGTQARTWMENGLGQAGAHLEKLTCLYRGESPDGMSLPPPQGI